jgi:hypothetical protein
MPDAGAMRTRIFTAVCLLSLTAAATATAAPPKTAKFKASISGTQVITWSYDKPAEGPCSAENHGAGSVQMRFQSRTPGRIGVVEIRRSNPLFQTTHGRPYVGPLPETKNGKLVLDAEGRPRTQPLMASASADVEGDWSFGAPSMPSQCEDNGGGVVPQPKDCGVRSSYIDIELAYVHKNKLLVGGKSHGWNFAARPNDYSGHDLGLAFENCPFWVGGAPVQRVIQGNLEKVPEPLKEKELLTGKRRTFVLHGGAVNCFDEQSYAACGSESGPFRGKTVTAWKLTLKRMR